MLERGRVTFWAAFAVFALIGVTWAMSIAPMGAPDEIAHSRRAVAVARGQLTTEVRWLETPVVRAPLTTVRIPFGYAQGFAIGNDLTNCWVNDLGVPASCAPRPATTSGPARDSATYVGSYQPLYYLLVGLPSRWLPPSTGWYAMRAISALLAAALLASAAVSVGELARRPWVVVGAAAALTPSVLFLSGSINPNGVEIAAAVAVWTALLALLGGRGVPGRRQLLRVGLAATALACARPTSPLLLVVIVATALAHGATRSRLAELWASPRFRVVVAGTGAVLVANLAFVIVNRSLGNVIHTVVEPHSRGELLRHGLHLVPGWFDEALGSLSWIGYGAVPLPVWTRWLWWAVVVVVLALGLLRGTNRQRAVVVGLVGACVAGPVAASVLEPEVQWQGRYALPLLVGIPLLAGLAADRAAPGAVQAWRERLVASGLLAVVAGCQVVAHQQLMVRNLLGLPGRLLRGILHAPWHGPVPPIALLAMAVLGSLGFLGLALAGVWRPAEDPSATPVALADPTRS